MQESTTYYAVIDELSSREKPAGVFRRVYFADGGMEDEAFTSNLVWEPSSLLAASERGDMTNDFVDISEDEASQIVDRFRAQAARADDQRPPD
jgi:hypothetical protein